MSTALHAWDKEPVQCGARIRMTDQGRGNRAGWANRNRTSRAPSAGSCR